MSSGRVSSASLELQFASARGGDELQAGRKASCGGQVVAGAGNGSAQAGFELVERWLDAAIREWHDAVTFSSNAI
jgi:hypothetical protein